jgi:ABC-type nitrate/sulfonate/bicarbonate transport system substrate-binding protein
MKRTTGIVIVGISVALLLGSSCSRNKEHELTFAAANDVWWTAPTIVAETHQLFQNHGVNIKSFDVSTGLASKNAVVSRNAEIGLVASTPLAMGAYAKEDVRILCSYVESNSLIAFLTAKPESPIAQSANHIAVSPIAIVPRTISEWYFVNYLKKHNLISHKSEIRELHVNPADVPNVLNNGDANSAVIWEPFASFVPAERFQATRDPDLYSLRLFLISRPDVIKNKPEAIAAFLASVNDACTLIAKDRDGVREELETRFHYRPGFLKELWGKVDFSVKYDFEKMRELILADAHTAIELGYTPRKSLPEVDYLFYDKSAN